jgi:hypothetical protein
VDPFFAVGAFWVAAAVAILLPLSGKIEIPTAVRPWIGTSMK